MNGTDMRANIERFAGELREFYEGISFDRTFTASAERRYNLCKSIEDKLDELDAILTAEECAADPDRREGDRETMENTVKYPGIVVTLTGQDGNAMVIMGLVRKAMREGHVPPELISDFSEEATSGDYNHLLQTCMKWVNVE